VITQFLAAQPACAVRSDHPNGFFFSTRPPRLHGIVRPIFEFGLGSGFPAPGRPLPHVPLFFVSLNNYAYGSSAPLSPYNPPGCPLRHIALACQTYPGVALMRKQTFGPCFPSDAGFLDLKPYPFPKFFLLNKVRYLNSRAVTSQNLNTASLPARSKPKPHRSPRHDRRPSPDPPPLPPSRTLADPPSSVFLDHDVLFPH